MEIQATRNLLLLQGESPADAKAFVRDRGSQFTASFDEVFRTPPTDDASTPPTGDVIRLPRCDGLVNEYKNAA